MRTIAACTLAALVVSASVRADDRETALAVVEQAIKAHGGADALARSANSSRSGKGTITVEGKELAVTTEAVLSLPDKERVAVVVEKQLPITIVLNNDKGWKLTGGAAADLPKDSVEDLRGEAYVWWLATLVPLKKAPFELSPVPEIKVSGKAAVGVKAVNKGRPDAKLYFDKLTGLLVKIEVRAKEAGLEVFKEYFYSDHKEIDGVKVALREVKLVNGRASQDVILTAFKVLPKPDESAFGKP
jgi:hypothetical protein